MYAIYDTSMQHDHATQVTHMLTWYSCFACKSSSSLVRLVGVRLKGSALHETADVASNPNGIFRTGQTA